MSTEQEDLLDSIGRDYKNGFADGYDQGRTDAIEEIYKKAEEKIKEQIEYLNQSPRNGKMWARYMTTYLGHIKTACEQLKEHNNDKAESHS